MINKNITDKKERRAAVSVYSLPVLAEELGFTLKKVGTNYYTLEEHDSVRINIAKNDFKQFSTGINGDNVAFLMGLGKEVNNKFKSLDYCLFYLEKKMKIYNNLSKDKSNKLRTKVVKIKEKKELPPLVLPLKNFNNDKIIKYLEDRLISRKTIDYFINNNMLYQSAETNKKTGYKTNNLVFTSYNEDGKLEFISEKSSIKGYRFMKEHAGNNYDHCFYIDNKQDTLIVTEAVIDLMSFMDYAPDTVEKSNFLSINSVYKYQSVFEHLKKDKKINKVIIALDNDEPGNLAAKKIENTIKKEFKNVKPYLLIVPEGKDWNEYLEFMHKYNENKKESNYDQELVR